LDDELVAGLKLAKTKRCYFALVVKGATDGALVISKQKVPPVLITLAKKQCGGSAVVKGAVFFEDGKYVFETAKVQAATMPNALKAIAKRDAGMSIVAVCRVGTNPDLLDDDDRQQAAAGGEANKTLKESGPEAKAKTTDAPKPSLEAAYQARVKSLTDDLKKAITSGTPAGNEAKLRFSESQLFSRKKDFAKAMPLLDAVEDRIKEALAAIAGSAASRQTAKSRDGVGAADGPQLTKRLNALTADIKLALAGRNQARVKSLFVAVSGQIKNKNFAQASKGLDELEGLLNGAPGTNESPANASKAPGLSAALALWTTERGKVIKDLQTLQGHITGMNHPDGDAAIILVKAILANLSTRPETAQSVAELERYITTDEIISEAEGPNGFGIKIDIRSGLLPALAAIRAALAA
jgi:hypothetical protein